MNDLRKAAEMALEALENIDRWLPTIGQRGLRDYEADAIQALRQALAEDALKTVADIDHSIGLFIDSPNVDETAKGVHEPVAWINYNAATGEETINQECHSELASTPLYKTPLQKEITCVCGAVWDGELMTIPPRENKQEPVAWLWKNIDGHQVLTDDPDYADGTWTPLYTAPPQKEWVGLTASEVHECYDLNPARFANRIEAKLKEKNT